MTNIKNIKKMTGFVGMLFALSFMFTTPYAEAQSELGGGGNGLCTPPTMGLNKAGATVVDAGFTINGQVYDVERYDQDISITSFNTGETNEIVLKIHEDTSSSNLIHVGLALVTPQENNSKLTEIKSIIEWDKDHEGKETIQITDSNDKLQDVNVTMDEKENLAILTFSFEASEQLDPVALKVTTWDRKLCSWNNTFEFVQVGDDKLTEKTEAEVTKTYEQIQAKEISDKILENTKLTCGIKVLDANLNYGPLNVNEISSEVKLIVSNMGNADAELFVKVAPWKDSSNIELIDADYTRFSISSDTDFADMTSASESGESELIGTIYHGSPLTTFWKVQTVLNDFEFKGSLSQTMEFSAAC